MRTSCGLTFLAKSLLSWPTDKKGEIIVSYYIDHLTLEKTDKNYRIAEYVKEHRMSLLDFDCWAQLQSMAGTEVDYDTYHAVDDLLEETVMDTDAAIVIAAYEIVQMGMDKKLLPCPFCGNKAIDTNSWTKDEFHDGDALSFECPNCHAQMWSFKEECDSYFEQDYDSRFEQLVEKWNTRIEQGA